MRISENALNVLAAKTYKGIGKAWIVKNIKGDDSPDKLVALLNDSAKEERIITSVEFERVRNTIRESILALTNFADGVVAIGDKEFPSHRGNVKNSEKPIALQYRGNLRLLDKSNKNIAVIGLTNPDKQTEAVESEMVSKLVNQGATIVSGLALGCDSIAHRQALLSKGKTIAILPSPLSEILPSRNRKLAEDVVESDGLLITEYYDNAKSKMELSARYQERDRLQALFSDCVVLAASYAKNNMGLDSGARLAMEYATSYSIPRAVMYDSETDVSNPKFDLNRQLIRDQRGIVIINRENMDRAIADIIHNESQQPAEPIGQHDLFG